MAKLYHSSLSKYLINKNVIRCQNHYFIIIITDFMTFSKNMK